MRRSAFVLVPLFLCLALLLAGLTIYHRTQSTETPTAPQPSMVSGQGDAGEDAQSAISTSEQDEAAHLDVTATERVNPPEGEGQSSDPVSINFGDTIQGAINSAGETDTYLFSGSAGDVVLVRMAEPAGSLYPEIRLYGPDSSLLQTVYGSSLAEISQLLPTTGQYTVVAADHYGDRTGNYGVFLQRTNNPGNTTPFTLGQTISGSITLYAEMDSYTFTASAGDAVLVRMADSTSLYPEIRLYGPDGALLQTIYDSSLTEITRSLPTAGQYTVLAGEHYGYYTGNYGLFVQRTNNPGNATAIGFGQTISTSITLYAEMDSCTFTANAGDAVLVRIGEPAGSLYPEIRLYGPDGTLLQSVYGSSLAEISQSLPTTGQYTVLAGDYNGYHTGNYGLFVQRTNNPGNATAIGFGQIVSTSIALYAEMDSYTFTVSAGDAVLVRMADSTSLYPEIRLYGPDGTLLQNVYNSSLAEISQSLVTAGQYTLLAGDDNGYYTGNYGLFVQRTNNPGNATPFTFGQTVTTSIALYGEMDSYTFTANAGDDVLVRIGEPAGSIYPEIRLYGPDGTLLQTVYSSSLAEISQSLPTTGLYTVLAGDYNGYHTGNYGLFVQRTNNPGNTTPFTLGQTISGSLTLYGEMDSYTFTASAGDDVLVRIADYTSVYPDIRLYGPDGALLRTVYDSSLAEISESLPTTGQYTILAGDHNGYYTGNYGLFVQRTNNPGNATAIGFGQTISTSLTLYAEMDSYTITANAGDALLVRIAEPTGSLYPEIRLYGPDGALLQTVYAGTLVEISQSLPTTGQYTILAGDHYGYYSGNYGLFVQRTNDPGNTAAIGFGQTIAASTALYAEMDSYTFAANAGDAVLVRIADYTSASPEIRLYGPDGALLQTVYGSSLAQISQSLPATGQYTVLAGDHNGYYTGDYGLFVQRTNNPGNAAAVGFGQTISGSITLYAEMDSYTFTANAGDAILVRIGEPVSSLYPEIRLYGPDGTLLQTVYNSSLAEISQSLPTAGQYTVLAGDHNGYYTGNYGLLVQRTNNPGNATAVGFGQTIPTSITLYGEMNSFTFTAGAGDDVLVRMGEHATSLYPEIRLYWPDGTLLQTVYGSHLAEISQSLPAAGQYTILAGDHNGYYAGDYGLFVQRTNNPGNAAAIGFGQTISSSITQYAEMDSYTFTGNAGDAVLVRMAEPASTSFYPEIRLYSPDGTLLQTVYGSSLAEISQSLPTAGQYTVLAGDHYGYYTGSYRLSLNPGTTPTVVTSVSPDHGGQGEILTTIIAGNYFTDASNVDFGPGVAVNSFTVDSATQITAQISISSLSTLGARNVSVSTPNGTGTLVGGFTVLGPKSIILHVFPDQGARGQTLTVVVSGLYFGEVTDVDFGTGITVNSFSLNELHLNGLDQITVSITIDAGADLGLRDVSVTTPSGTGTKTGGFTVVE
ncbi:MAG: hypothetical protein JW753_07480 [Dehalococcoidia bacterium]|nr:hypothetical protein [Dehalococcoidia bacterium]